VLKKGVSGKNAVVWLNYSSRYLRRRVYAESKLGFATVVNAEALKEKRAKTGASTTTNSVKAKESLKTSAVVSQLADAVEYDVNNFLADGVVATSVVVSSIFLSGDDLLWVVERAVGTGANFVTYGGLKIYKNSAGYVLASTSFGEKGVESVIATTDGLVGRHLSVGLNAMFEAVQLPASITGLNASLADVDRDYFTHVDEGSKVESVKDAKRKAKKNAKG
jgi:hypothetical protein